MSVRFEDCDGEAAMKRRYLQIRVQKAAMAKAQLSEEQLERRRADLGVQIIESGGRTRELREKLQQITIQRRSLKNLLGIQNRCEGTIGLAREQFQRLLSHSSLRSSPSLSQSTLITVRECVEGLSSHPTLLKGEPREDDPILGEFLKLDTIEALQALDVLQAEVESSTLEIAHVQYEVDFERGKMAELQKMGIQIKSIQQVALSLASILRLINQASGREEAMGKLEELQTCCQASLEYQRAKYSIDKTRLSKIFKPVEIPPSSICEHEQTCNVGKFHQNCMIRLKELLEAICSSRSLITDLPTLLATYAQRLVTKDPSSSPRIPIDQERSPSFGHFATLWQVIIEYALTASATLSDCHTPCALLSASDEANGRRMDSARNAVQHVMQDWNHLVQEMKADFTAIEALQRPDLQSLLNTLLRQDKEA